MTKTQLERWVDFARRMAAQAGSYRTPHRRRALELVNEFFANYTDPDDPPKWNEWDDGPGDETDQFLWDRRPQWCAMARWGEKRAPIHPEHDEDDGESRFAWWRDSPAPSLFLCAIRAGLDVACEQSAGVIGFTVNDLRRMYPGGLPGWLVEAFGEQGPKLRAAPDSTGVWL